MEAYNYLKQIYTGKRAIYNHVTIFSLLGIMVIFLNNLAASWGSSLYIDIFAIPPSTSFELWVALLGGGLIALYLFGYSYQYLHSLFRRDECSLLEFDFIPFGTFFKVFPMFFLWQNYIILSSVFLTLIILAVGSSILLYVLWAIILVLLPFVQMILISFCSRFKYRLKFFYPWIIFKYVDKAFSDVLKLFVQVMSLSVLPLLAIVGVVVLSTYITNEVYQYALELVCLCLGVYVFVILKYVFSVGLVRIVKEKFMP